jgi:hypothetical protein
MTDIRKNGGPSDKLQRYEAWWPFIARVIAFLLGTTILFWQTVLEQADRPYLIGGALVLMGFPIAAALAKGLEGR